MTHTKTSLYSKLLHIAEGYAIAREIIYQRIQNDWEVQMEIENLIFPLLYIIRHEIELSLKISCEYHHISREGNHDLTQLWEQLNIEQILLDMEEEDYRVSLSEAKKTIDRFITNDPKGTEFRYLAKGLSPIIDFKDFVYDNIQNNDLIDDSMGNIEVFYEYCDGTIKYLNQFHS